MPNATITRWLIERAGRRKLVTWEQRCQEPDVLILTNVWPHSERHAYGPFLRRTVEGLEAVGVRADVLFIRGYNGFAAYLYAAAIMLLLGASKRRYPLVHAHGGETALPARLYMGAPVVASYLGSDLLAPQEGGRLLRLKCWLRSAVLRRHASLMTATTTKTREMESLLSRGAREHNRVIPDGIDLEQFTPIARDEARRALGWSSEARIVLFAGRAESPGKRLWLAQAAVEMVRGQIPNLELMVASGIDPNEMPRYYSAADCLLHTSASEGSPNVIKEALACNLPIIATPAGDIEELLEGSYPGKVVAATPTALAEEILECCRVPQRSNGRTLTGRMTTERAADATLGLYRDLHGPLAARYECAVQSV
jgi:teichuronic acid biosynthesis glycosyltransferase TuaC